MAYRKPTHRAYCSCCGRAIAVMRDGRLYKHGELLSCPGSYEREGRYAGPYTVRISATRHERAGGIRGGERWT